MSYELYKMLSQSQTPDENLDRIQKLIMLSFANETTEEVIKTLREFGGTPTPPKLRGQLRSLDIDDEHIDAYNWDWISRQRLSIKFEEKYAKYIKKAEESKLTNIHTFSVKEDGTYNTTFTWTKLDEIKYYSNIIRSSNNSYDAYQMIRIPIARSSYLANYMQGSLSIYFSNERNRFSRLIISLDDENFIPTKNRDGIIPNCIHITIINIYKDMKSISISAIPAGIFSIEKDFNYRPCIWLISQLSKNDNTDGSKIEHYKLMEIEKVIYTLRTLDRDFLIDL